MFHLGSSISDCPMSVLLEHPIMVIEQAAPSYYSWKKKTRFEHTRLDQARARAPFLVKVILIFPSPSQIYIAKRLDCPHYQIEVSHLVDFLVCCETLRVQVEFACPRRSLLHLASFVSYVNTETAEYGTLVRSIMDKVIKHRDLYHYLRRSSNAVRDRERGNVQESSGFAALNLRVNNDEGVTAPVLKLNMTTFWFYRLLGVTRLIDTLLPGNLIYRHRQRQNIFAATIGPELGLGPRSRLNRIESATAGFTVLGKHLLAPHSDRLNDFEDWKFAHVVCCSKILFIGTEWIRVVFIAYGRHACYTHMTRLVTTRAFSNDLLDYIRSLPESRIIPDETLLHRSNVFGKTTEPRRLPPCLSKSVYYSPFVHILRLCFFTWRFNLNKFVECLWPMLLFNSPDVYWYIFGSWLSGTSMPVGNLALRFLRLLPRAKAFVKMQNWPEGRRTMPSSNGDVLKSKVLSSLAHLKKALKMAMAGDSYTCVYEWIKANVHFAGSLGSQHLLAIASLCGVIPPLYAETAVLNKGTRTYERITEMYGITAAKADSIIAGAGRRLGYTTGFLENSVCEFLRDRANPGRTLWWDSVYPSQKIYFMNSRRIYAITHASGNIRAEEVVIPDPTNEGGQPWTMQNGEDDMSYTLRIHVPPSRRRL
jgi:hypothetical protein